jgi:hypothetical protein
LKYTNVKNFLGLTLLYLKMVPCKIARFVFEKMVGGQIHSKLVINIFLEIGGGILRESS